MTDLPRYDGGLLKPLRELTALQLYALLRLRVDVFVVEQACIYPEVDALDAHPDTLHLLHFAHSREFAISESANLQASASVEVPDDVPALAACARLLAPAPAAARAPAQAEMSPVLIGRVATALNSRRQGIAVGMLTFLLDVAQQRWPGAPIELSAQTQALALYARLGFVAISDEYLDEGIPHVTMRYAER